MKKIPLLASTVGYSLCMFLGEQYWFFRKKTICQNVATAVFSGVLFLGLMVFFDWERKRNETKVSKK